MKNKKIIVFIVLFLLSIYLGNLSFSQDFDSFLTEGIELVVGELKTIKAASLTRVNIVDPEIANINKVEGNEIFISAKKPGTTTLTIWDKAGEYSLSISVLAEDFENLRNRLKQILGNFKINNLALKDNRDEGKIIISGEVAAEEKESLDGLLAPFEQKIINLLKPIDETALVQIDVQVLELTESGSKELGITWMSALQVREEPYSSTTTTTGGVVTTLNRINTFGNVFRIVEWSRDALTAKLNLLVSEGKAKVLSRPKLVCMSGKDAEFLVGGEIPIVTTATTTGGTVQTNVEFRPYGVNLRIKPIVKEDRIDTTLNTEVSDVDYGNAVTVSGARIPAFASRSASTQLYLKDGQTVFIAGLIKHSDSNNVSGIPGLSNIPIIGSLFRSRSLSDKDTELVISLTPTIIRTEGEPIVTQQTTLTELPHISKAMPEVTEESISSTPISSAHIAEAAPASETIPEPILSYVRLVQERIAQNIAYPEEAMKAKEEGTVKLNLLILFDGSLMEASIKESSGINIFDKNAVDTAKKLAPYPAFPSEITAQEISIEIPISYNLDNF